MSKLEEILPEIREGRRARPKGTGAWLTLDTGLTVGGEQIIGPWELEPEITELEVSSWKFKVQPNYGLAIYFKEDFVGNMTFEHIDEFHAFSLKARGIEEKPKDTQQFASADLGHREYIHPPRTGYYDMEDQAGRMCEASYRRGHMAGWEAYQKALEEE